jgi:cytochrome c oxidase subunit II
MPLFHPVSQQAHAISQLLALALVLSAVVFGGIVIVMSVILWRFRDTRQNAADEPRAVFGHPRVEIVWTALPVLTVALLFALTLGAMRSSDPSTPPDRPADVVLIAHQWWWEIRYPAARVLTANDLHIPVGAKQLVELQSADVIHDFWVPRLGRKIDMVPGHPVRLWLTADSGGTYSGACAEYCGTEHAWMRLRVTAEPPATFASWLAAQQRPAGPAAATSDSAAAQGASLYSSLTCVNCHAIQGTADTARIGPDLTHLATRPSLAAERLPNTPANLRRWLAEPDVVKPGSHMPNLHLSDRDLNLLTAYLLTLR